MIDKILFNMLAFLTMVLILYCSAVIAKKEQTIHDLQIQNLKLINSQINLTLTKNCI